MLDAADQGDSMRWRNGERTGETVSGLPSQIDRVEKEVNGEEVAANGEERERDNFEKFMYRAAAPAHRRIKESPLSSDAIFKQIGQFLQSNDEYTEDGYLVIKKKCLKFDFSGDAERSNKIHQICDQVYVDVPFVEDLKLCKCDMYNLKPPSDYKDAFLVEPYQDSCQRALLHVYFS